MEIDQMPDWKQGTPWHTERVDEIHAITRSIHAIEDQQINEERQKLATVQKRTASLGLEASRRGARPDRVPVELYDTDGSFWRILDLDAWLVAALEKLARRERMDFPRHAHGGGQGLREAARRTGRGCALSGEKIHQVTLTLTPAAHGLLVAMAAYRGNANVQSFIMAQLAEGVEAWAEVLSNQGAVQELFLSGEVIVKKEEA